MDPDAIQRFARHLSLPEIGLEGQERLAAACVVVAGDDLGAEVAARYLAAAGVGTVRVVGAASGAPWPINGLGWQATLEDARADLVVRSGFDDDAMLGAVKRLGLPAIVMRGRADAVDLLSFPSRPAAAEAPLDTPTVRAERAPDGAAAVVAGALAAAEAIHVLVGGGSAGRAAGARHLRLPLDERAPQVQEIPWR